MSNGISLEQARIQLNMPNASEAEVRTAAQANNLVIIDFSGGYNSSDVNIGSDITLFGGQQPASTAGQGDDFGFGDLVSFGNTTPASQTQTVVQNAGVNSANQTGETDKKQNALEQRTSEILKQIFGDKEVKIKSKEVKDGKQVVVTEDGTTIEIPLKEGEEGYDPTKVRTGVSYRIYKKGKVTVKLEDGSEKTRDAHKGEPGYVKTGESLEERLKRCYPGEYKKADTPEKKAALIKRYFVSYFNELEKRGKSKEQIARLQMSDYQKLMTNTDQDSEWAQIMGQTLHSLRSENRVKAFENLAETCDTDELLLDASTAVLDNMEESNDSPAVQNALIASVIDKLSKTENIPPEKRAKLNENAIKGISKCSPEAQDLLLQVIDNDACTTRDLAHLSKLFGEDENGKRVLTPAAEKFAAEIMARRASDEEGAQITANAHSRMRKENQLGAVDYAYEHMNEDLIGAYNVSVADNIVNFDKDNTLEVGQRVIDHDDEESTGAKTLAGHGHELDASVQTAFVRMLTELNNEDVSTIIADNAYNYDLTNRDDVIKMLQEQGFDKTMEALENARKAYEEQSAQAKANSDAQRAEMERQQALQSKTDNSAQTDNRTSAKEKVSATQNIKTMVKSDGLARAVSSDSFREFKTKEKEEFINNLGKTDRKEAIQTIVENAQGFELDSLMFSGLKNDILSYLVSHPTPQNNDKLKYLQRYLSPSDKAMVREMEQENMTRAEQLQVKAEEARAENQNNPNQNRVNNPFKFGFITRN